ncbi:hypothetical protein BpHYR1_021388 [Brachionus plicatilis]|uniref:Uncharacterized protein n=1 Tax=Brachionus plicatilis TaxID=10195 RepID=A0A3M7PI40_BRAPC|nr:hypothetical protein BpHYR1_021388 [Brachionus plicatilis]
MFSDSSQYKCRCFLTKKTYLKHSHFVLIKNKQVEAVYHPSQQLRLSCHCNLRVFLMLKRQSVVLLVQHRAIKVKV